MVVVLALNGVFGPSPCFKMRFLNMSIVGVQYDLRWLCYVYMPHLFECFSS